MTDLPDKQKQSQPTILSLFEDSIKADGTVDLRSRYGRTLRSLTERLNDNVYETSKQILQDSVAVSATIQKVVEAHIVANPELLCSTGDDAQFFLNSFLKLKNETRKSIQALNDLERKHKGAKGNGQAFDDIILD